MADPNERRQAWLEKAERFLSTSRQALSAGDSETAVSRAYYGVFHAIHALLNEREVLGSHTEVINRCVQWNQRYTRLDAIGPLTGGYRDLRRSLLGLQRWRNEADYQLGMTDETKARNAMEFADRLLRVVKESMG